MAIGKSNRIVVELDTDFKQQIYCALKVRGLTFKEWLVEQVITDLLTQVTKEDSYFSKRNSK